MKTVAVIGKNYGDEGKGLVTASLCLLYHHPLVIKHNGGAQAGHTVENQEQGRRLIHHQIGCGAEYGADTLFADTYHPDLYQIQKEVNEFENLYGFRPRLYGESKAKITTIDDVLLNMAIETKRGNDRHGSCGMGINECVERISAGYSITLDEVKNSSTCQLLERLKVIRERYTIPRANQLGIDDTSPYMELLINSNVLQNFAEDICKNSSLIQIIDANTAWLNQYDGVIFENGQGLLLDQDYLENAPHLTSSKTGIIQPLKFLQKREMKLDEVIYVTRSYMTKHGAGPLPNEFDRNDFPSIELDITNEPNEWQGSIRYATHDSITDFEKSIISDIQGTGIIPSLAITHLNETNGQILFKNETLGVDELIAKVDLDFQNVYESWNHWELTI